jgi:hypothetical protein
MEMCWLHTACWRVEYYVGLGWFNRFYGLTVQYAGSIFVASELDLAIRKAMNKYMFGCYAIIIHHQMHQIK